MVDAAIADLDEETLEQEEALQLASPEDLTAEFDKLAAAYDEEDDDDDDEEDDEEDAPHIPDPAEQRDPDLGLAQALAAQAILDLVNAKAAAVVAAVAAAAPDRGRGRGGRGGRGASSAGPAGRQGRSRGRGTSGATEHATGVVYNFAAGRYEMAQAASGPAFAVGAPVSMPSTFTAGDGDSAAAEGSTVSTNRGRGSHGGRRRHRGRGRGGSGGGGGGGHA